jgi:hypothetical protein
MESLTADLQMAFVALQTPAFLPRLRRLLYGNIMINEIVSRKITTADTTMVFGATSLMYKMVPAGDPDENGIDENELETKLDRTSSSDKSRPRS